MPQCRVGICGRNDFHFREADYKAIRVASLETVKMMSHTDVSVYQRLREQNPNIEFIVRLYDDRMYYARVTPQQFVEKMAPLIQRLRPWVTKFEIHNEPNHYTGLEGWGPSDDHARDFNAWFLEVLKRLRQVAPWAEFGFPGLAIGDYPHRDRAWLQICRPAIEAADWLGVHCYWQYDNMTHPDWGLRFLLYHQLYPTKPLEITEFSDSTNQAPDGSFRRVKSEEEIAQEYVTYYRLLRRYPFVRSANAFILSSPSPEWRPFVWCLEDGTFLPMVEEVARMARDETTQDDAVWRAEWVAANVPSEIPLGIGTTASFTIRNTGTTTWQNTGPNRVRLGYHWYDMDGRPVPADADIRTELPKPVAPGEAVEISGARVVPPPWPGRYVLEWDLVEEGRAWFASRGNTPHRVTVQVVLTPESKRTFPETGKTVEQPFLSFFYRYGLEITGYPVTDVIVENGMRAQYWQRVAMEEYEPGKVRLKLVGSEVLDLRRKVEELKQWLSLYPQPDVPEPRIQNVVDKLPRDAARMIKRNLAEVRYIVFDHTAISRPVPLERLAEAVRRRYPGMPYHYYIDSDGTIYQTEPLEEVILDRVDHVRGIRIGLAGNFSETIPTEAQLSAAAQLTAWLLVRFRLPPDAVKGTSEFIVTESPGRNWLEGERWRDMLLMKVEEWLRTSDPRYIPEVEKPPIVDVVDALPKHPEKRYRIRPLSDITHIAIHHSAASGNIPPENIARFHVEHNDWPGIGYHFYITADGTIYQTNRLTTMSYHVYMNNHYAVGVCLAGNFSEHLPTPAQLASAARLVAWLMGKLNIPIENVWGHREFPRQSTQCPGTQWRDGFKWHDMLLARIRAALRGELDRFVEKPLGHYVLFWQKPDSWAREDWLNSINYVARYRPTMGFSYRDAQQAKRVTIVGGPLGVPEEVERLLREAGCVVRRVAGKTAAETKALLDKLAEEGDPFLSE